MPEGSVVDRVVAQVITQLEARLKEIREDRLEQHRQLRDGIRADVDQIRMDCTDIRTDLRQVREGVMGALGRVALVEAQAAAHAEQIKAQAEIIRTLAARVYGRRAHDAADGAGLVDLVKPRNMRAIFSGLAIMGAITESAHYLLEKLRHVWHGVAR